ncbi:MAG: hypothetical protein R3C45_18415 [Phycisphaerales bacterium]
MECYDSIGNAAFEQGPARQFGGVLVLRRHRLNHAFEVPDLRFIFAMASLNLARLNCARTWDRRMRLPTGEPCIALIADDLRLHLLGGFEGFEARYVRRAPCTEATW